MSQRYIGGLETLNPTPLNPALGNATNGIFSMSQYFSLKNQGLWPSYDPYFDYTTLLLHGNGTNGGQNNTFQDSSSNNFTITRNGNTTQGTFSPFSQTGWSNYFDGSGDYLQAGTSSNLALGSGDFTVEGWHFCTGYNGGGALYSTINTYPSSTGFLFYIYSDGSYTIDVNGTILKTTAVAALNTWVHYAVVRSGSTITIYANGTSVGTVSNSTNFTDQYAVIGRTGAGSASNYYLGYLSNCRTVKGTAVYTSAFTPPTAPLTAITNTQFLTCQSNRFIDNSANQFTITVNGNTSVQAFSPFAPTAAYSASTVGGSGYFDGSGDYLSVADNAAFDFGSGDFTIECWAYTDTFASQYNVLVCQWNTSYSFIFRITSSLVGLYINVGNPYTLQDYSASVTNTTGQWNHFCVTRSGSTLTFYKNGASIGTSSISATITNAASDLTVGVLGDLNATTYHKGYISGMRLIKGTAVAPTITTPPTAVSGTSLLLNFTNAAIIDNTAKNVLETVGNAQISTAQSKFGGGSMAFDGTGDWLKSPATIDTAFGTGDFTVECWVYHTTNQSNNMIVSNRSGSGTNTMWALEFYGTNNRLDWHSGTAIILSSNTTASLNTWNHVAVTRSGTSLKMYLNGTEVASATDTRNYSHIGPVQVGYEDHAGISGVGYLNGYIDDLRITKGIARYTSNFTPQTSQWQDQ